MTPKARKKSAAKVKRKAPMGFLIEGVAMFCPRIKQWVIRLDDDSGFSALGYTSALRQFRGRRVQFWVRP